MIAMSDDTPQPPAARSADAPDETAPDPNGPTVALPAAGSDPTVVLPTTTDGTAVATAGVADGGGPAPFGMRRRRRLPQPSGAGAVIGLLFVLLGFALVVQVRSNTTDSQVSSARTEDLVRILSDLDAREQRLNREIEELEDTCRQLDSGAEGRDAALAESRRRADEIGILAGTLPAQVIGDPQTMQPALNIPGGVVDSLKQKSGSVAITQSDTITIATLHKSDGFKHARPVR